GGLRSKDGQNDLGERGRQELGRPANGRLAGGAQSEMANLGKTSQLCHASSLHDSRPAPGPLSDAPGARVAQSYQWGSQFQLLVPLPGERFSERDESSGGGRFDSHFRGLLQ